MSIRLLLFFWIGLAQEGWAQGSAANLADAQAGMADQSWPKKPGNQTSAFSGKMITHKQIDMRSYEKGKAFSGARLYEDRKESALASTALWEQGTLKYDGQKSSWSGRKMSGMDGKTHQDFGAGNESAWQKKQELEMKNVPNKASPDWATRTSCRFQRPDGSLAMYEGSLTRVRETVVRQDTETGRDLGEGKKEMFDPHEVQKLLESKGRTADPHQAAPEKVPIRAESAGAFRPVVAGSSPNSP